MALRMREARSLAVALQVEDRAHRDPHGNKAPSDVDGSTLAVLFSLDCKPGLLYNVQCTPSAARGKTVP